MNHLLEPTNDGYKCLMCGEIIAYEWQDYEVQCSSCGETMNITKATFDIEGTDHFRNPVMKAACKCPGVTWTWMIQKLTHKTCPIGTQIEQFSQELYRLISPIYTAADWEKFQVAEREILSKLLELDEKMPNGLIAKSRVLGSLTQKRGL